MKTKDLKCKEGFENIKQYFVEYLNLKGFRKTPERFNVIKEIFIHEGHFDVDSLYLEMKNKKYIISRATLYNTIELLLDCHLIVKHQFNEKTAIYELIYGTKDHDHFVCLKCNKIYEFSDDRIQNIENDIANKIGAKIIRHNFYIYGLCENCKNK